MNDTGEYQLHVLGVFKLEHDAHVVKFSRRKAAALFAYLALHPQIHRRDELATLLWGDYLDDEARQSLSTALSALRRELGEDVLIVDRETVRLNPTFPLWVDAVSFETYARRFLAEPPYDLSTAFINLYEGDLLPDIDDDWVVAEREHLRRLYLDVLLHVAQQMRSRSEYDHAIQFAQRVLAVEPSNERAHQHMMFCFIALGDRSAALRQYGECKRALEEDLAAEPLPETTALYKWLKGRPAHAPAREALLTNLPIPLTSFIGREQEMAEVKRRLGEHRLVTLSGPGGSGKTRLAIQVAADLVDAYKDGVWFTDLTTIQDTSSVPLALARTLGVEAAPNQPVTDAVVAFLRTKHALLVLDNCEHLAGACAQIVNTVLTASPRVTILCTSREALSVQGEATCAVPPLSLPSVLSTPSLAALMQFEGTRLFVARAVAAAPDLAWSEQDAGAVAAICRQLDGMPLAIELATARLKVLSLRQIADHLQDRFDLLISSSRSVPRRQQSLRATIEWSYDLLSSEEQALLRCLSVFVGGCSLAGAVAASGRDLPHVTVLDLLSRLVDKSLVIVDRAGDQPRYRLLETIRLYAWDRLLEAGEKDVSVRRYITFVCTFVEDAEMRLMSGEMQADREVMADYDNIRSVITWCQETGDIERGLRTATPLWTLNRSEDIREPAAWLGAMLSSNIDVPPRVRGRAIAAAGNAARWQGNFERAFALAEQSVALCEPTGDKASIADALLSLGRSAQYLGKLDLAASCLERSLAFYREVGWQAAAIWPLLYLSQALVHRNGERALALSEEGLKISQKLNHSWGVTFALRLLGGMAQLRGDSATDVAYCKEALAICVRDGYSREIGFCLGQLADALSADGQAEQSAVLWGAASAASALFRMSLARDGPTGRLALGDQDSRFAGLRAQLGESVFQELVARGRAMTLEQAVAYALGDA